MTINTKLLVRFGIAVIATSTIFFVIQTLISQASELNKKINKPNFVEFIRIKQDDSLQERKRTIPDKPPTPKRPPQPQVELDVSKPPPTASLDFDMPDFSLPTDFSGAFMGNLESMGTGTSQLIPIVKVAPRCPRRHKYRESMVLCCYYNVNSNGRVSSVSIRSANPARIFNGEAIKAVRRWQFRPKTIDGIAVDQKGELLVEFSCNV